jgi:hypothetical protein
MLCFRLRTAAESWGGDARSGPDQRTQPLYLIRDVVPPAAYPETAAPATRRAAGAALLSTTNTVQRPVPSSDAPAAAMGVMHLALQPPAQPPPKKAPARAEPGLGPALRCYRNIRAAHSRRPARWRSRKNTRHPAGAPQSDGRYHQSTGSYWKRPPETKHCRRPTAGLSITPLPSPFAAQGRVTSCDLRPNNCDFRPRRRSGKTTKNWQRPAAVGSGQVEFTAAVECRRKGCYARRRPARCRRNFTPEKSDYRK